ncbi:hypothetical protein HO133_001983 [Letharia lupina]|uniref:MARVEL domain-containing protein n=1 Tax=Letharia lupina TaxID=560253 RepID=A0A8H6CEA8_9LECA|nr:uncharacterized protein HO133_001983 [Letharia lupina]KAF6222015.1 hypothetical protein HO133_001983 [Letharia lupina]
MLDIILIALRAVQALFAIIVLGLTAHVASYGLTPSSDSFMVFASVWTLLILIYLALAPRFFSAVAHPMAMLALDALTMLFWFAGFIALAVYHHQAERVYLGDGLGDVYKGCTLAGGFCGEIEAAAIFGAFEWALFVATTALLALEFMRGRGGRSSKNAAGPSTFGGTTQV